nr:hypothetical protein [Tanacetum cinerariifolium]
VDKCELNPSSSSTLNGEWHKINTVDKRPPQLWITQMAQAAGTQSSFNEFLATPIDFSAFIMNRLKIDNLTQEVLTGPTYDLIKGTCKSVVELEYHLEEAGAQVKNTTSITKMKAADYGQVKWIEDKKKINLKMPDTYRSDLRRMTPYTAYADIQGIIYEDEMNRYRLMRTNELHKFNNGTLNHVRTALNDIATVIEMDYLPKKK